MKNNNFSLNDDVIKKTVTFSLKIFYYKLKKLFKLS